MKKYMKIAQLIAMFGQLGFTLITPPVVMALLAWWLQSRLGWGSWIMIVFLLIGLITSAVSAYQFYLKVMSTMEKTDREKEPIKKSVVYYRHE